MKNTTFIYHENNQGMQKNALGFKVQGSMGSKVQGLFRFLR